MKMKKYLVTGEVVAIHQAVVEAENVDEAAEQYLDGEWLKDKGEILDYDSAMVLSVEEINE